MSEEIKGVVLFIGAIIIVLVACFGSIGIIEITANKLACNEFASINSDYEFRFDIMTGCKIKTPDGFWISTELIRYTNDKITFEEK
jgi:hypothetical protein